MDKESEAQQLQAMFERLGAEPSRAETMARQLSKRADQIAEREGISRMDALKRLLEIVRSGRSGETCEGL